MSAELSAAVGFVAAGLVTLISTPLAIVFAHRTGLYDYPREYRRHAAPTPLLGGAAVAVAFVVAAAVVGATGGRFLALLGCVIALWALGTVDDRIAVAPKWRLLAETGAAVVLVAVGLGWNTPAGGAVNALLTVVWIIGLVNAFNLMDNLDGACSAVAGVAAAGIGVLAVIEGDTTIAGLAFALSAACLVFLPWNLAGPAKIFLGDGGSMPVGFLVAALAMATTRHSDDGHAGVLVAALLAGLPILDMTLVSVSRMRRGVSLMTGGRDHLTHRILLALHSPRSVAAVLALAQGALCSIAVLGYELGTGAVAGFAFAAFITGVAVILVLDKARWRPAGIAVGPQSIGVERASATSVGVDSG